MPIARIAPRLTRSPGDLWIDFNFFNHQVVAHHVERPADGADSAVRGVNKVDGHGVPVPHFGVVLEWTQFDAFVERLRKHNVKFEIEPVSREGLGLRCAALTIDHSTCALKVSLASSARASSKIPAVSNFLPLRSHTRLTTRRQCSRVQNFQAHVFTVCQVKRHTFNCDTYSVSNSSKVSVTCLASPRRRTATEPLSRSLLPTTSTYGACVCG